MHNYYIINETVEFHPVTSTLRDIHHPDIVVTLNSPAGRCLLLLINRIGTVVTRHELMDTVWKKSGIKVTPNAYYQNISILRKGLKRIGLGEEIIVTLPRIGLTLATGTRIRKRVFEAAVDCDHEKSYHAAISDLSAEKLSENHLQPNVEKIPVLAIKKEKRVPGFFSLTRGAKEQRHPIRYVLFCFLFILVAVVIVFL
ncbi:hypothetical protein ED28_08235 [[Pantoea] beijingensis]|uniref:OmpR/PhoB-type domain-containing protein n=1 Tax=[Pantoea] beijingensis TaxID=1324864 RepID=A0A443IE80_9GAMM|nr:MULTISPECIES: winged helix-turn-helix domain-containing protein [Erwiniaceae]RWR02359.1 hypothetical protein ED28_08235 [[Pantoea] beijingensis]